MLRNEIQSKTGLTRKAIEYYEERGLAIPLIRKFSKPYDDYYTKLIVANDKYMEYYRREIK